jgi:diaminopimelate epimerase
MTETIAFRKMNGLGNDFVIVDARVRPLRFSQRLAAAIADRAAGVGCDQIIVLERTDSADVRMRIYNSDGSESGACGNATRCVATLINPASPRPVTIETQGGILRAELRADGLVSVDMGAPRFGWQDIPLSEPVTDTRSIDLTQKLPDGRVLERPSVVNVGNPHCIFWVDDAESYDLGAFGPALEHHPLFPQRANISLAETVSGSAIKLRVWERGAGLTRACGTAACAVAVAASRTGRTGRDVDVELRGGTLHIAWREEDDHIIMTGPSAFEFAGVLHIGETAGQVVSFERSAAEMVI